MSRAHSPILLSLLLRHKLCSFSNLSVTSPTSHLILQPFRSFTYVTAHSPSFRCFTYVTALFILQPISHITYVTTHSPTLPSLYLRHSSFSNPSVPTPKSQFILQPFFRFSYVTSSAHSPTFPSFHLRHSSFSNPSVAFPTSQRCSFSNISVTSPTS